MNLIGNSLKFTTSGYVLITLKELPPSKDVNEVSPGKDRIELSVVDTGKVGNIFEMMSSCSLLMYSLGHQQGISQGDSSGLA